MTEIDVGIEDPVERVTEGETILYVPKSSLGTNVPPRTPAFYNPYAELNRDLSMAAYRVFAEEKTAPVTVADSLAGVGARGVRVAVEVPEVDEIHINDLNPVAIELAKKSARANKVTGRCRFTVLDVCRFLAEHSTPKSRFDIVDIDPFGSPAPHLDCALRAIENEGLFSATATDMAVLCGVYPKVSYRKYHGHSLRTEYCHELGVRLLLGAVAHNAIRLELGVRPVFAHRTRHYFRVYMTVHIGSDWVDKTYDQIGYIQHCFKCGYRAAGSMPHRECPECKSAVKNAGPLWVGTVYSKRFLTALAEDCDRRSFRQGLKIAATALQEVDMPPAYFTIDKISGELGVVTPSLNSVISALEEEGYRASRSALNSKAVKTDASTAVLRRIVKRLTENQLGR
ncbi:MAG: tRNA (guanine(10)-N(2))-dimethyltransferase [Nitrososphaerales archaeon]